MLVFSNPKVGLYIAATTLAEATGVKRVEWLQRIAEALTKKVAGEMSLGSVIDALPEELPPKSSYIQPETTLSIPYFDLRKMESCGLQALNELAEGRCFTEPEGLKKCLRSIFIYRDQLIPWLVKNYSQDVLGLLPPDQTFQAREVPEQIIERELTRCRKHEEIVKMIDAEWTGTDRLTNEKIGSLFPKAENETKDALIQRGKRLRGKKT